MKKKKAIVIGGSKGIGASIVKNLKKTHVVKSLSSKELDTSNNLSIRKFLKKNKTTDILILNTGGPPPKKFEEISETEWYKYFNQFFLGFATILKNLKINKSGYIFLISSYHIREVNPDLIISNSLRVGFWSLLKTYSFTLSKNNITVVNIAPGPFNTKRLKKLNPNINKDKKSFPLKRIGNVMEIGKLVYSIVKYKIKYLNGTTIFIDGGLSKSLF